MEYVSNQADKAPALVLANLGYDVWLGNNRGNRFSLAHLSKKPSEKEFWDFHQQDMGEKDLPTIIDHITAVTG